MSDEKVKLQIKTWSGTVLFEYESVDNTIRKTVEEAVKVKADLSSADLSYADLRSANLRSADLRSANLSYANLRYADLSYANLSYADLSSADLSSANLSYADLRYAQNLPQSFINQCSRDMLFIFQSLSSELPFLRYKLVKGEVDGTQYEGDCACLIGTLANGDGGLKKVCEVIPYYDKGLHNFGEQWFWNIKKGDTPENNDFAKHALLLIDSVLKSKKLKKKQTHNAKNALYEKKSTQDKERHH